MEISMAARKMNGPLVKLLPVAIMAHNEEKVICNAVESALNQVAPTGYLVKVIVVSNACTDGTEEKVKFVEKQYPGRVVVLSTKEKGKTRAINKAIRYLDEISNTDTSIPYVVFLDADCEFYDKEVLSKMLRNFSENPKLCAIGANCFPDVFYNSRKDVVAEIYRAIYRLGESVKINAISGMCYGIRFDVLNKIDFPNFALSDSMFISSRLNGWFYRDKNIKIIFKTPFHLSSEIRKRTRQEISNQRYRVYYSYLRKKGIQVELFGRPLRDDYRWRYATDDRIVSRWLRLKGMKNKLLVAIFYLLSTCSFVIASIKIRRIGINADYWEVKR